MGPVGNRRAPLRALLRSGIAELRPDPAGPRAWTLLVNGVPQSYVDLDDPEHLEFPYQKLLGSVLRSWAPGRVHRQSVLHLGGGGMTMARLLEHIRPGISQVVVERDPEILAMVARLLPFPESVEIRIADARQEIESVPPASFDLIISDVYVGSIVPARFSTRPFFEACHRALRPDGLLLVNLTDVPPHARTRAAVATARPLFDEVILFGGEPVVRGRRVGNVILLAGNVPAIKPGKHERVLSGNDLQIFTGGARPLLDEPA